MEEERVGQQIRETLDQEYVDAMTARFPNFFSFKLHHGGRFSRYPGRTYVGGTIDYVDFDDIDKFSVHDLDKIMLELHYIHREAIYYHFLVPGENLDFGLQALGNDSDVMNLAKLVLVHKVISLYTEHGKTSLHTYFSSPTKVIIEEINDEEPVGPVGIEVRRNTSRQLQLGWHSGPVGPVGIEVRRNTSRQLQLGWHSGPGQSSGPGPSSRVGPSTGVADLDYDGDKDDNEQVGDGGDKDDNEQVGDGGDKDDNEQLGDGGDKDDNEQVGDGGDKDDNEQVDSDSDDSDFNGDDVNSIADVEVDMRDYRLNIDLDVEDNIISDQGDVEEEVLDNDVFESGSDVADLDYDEDDSDSDFNGDDVNSIADVEVDMRDYRLNIDLDVEDNIISDQGDVEEEVLEKVLDNDVFESGSDSDENATSIRKHNLKYLRRSNENSANFYLGQLFGSKDEAKKLIRAHSVETRRLIKILKDDKKRVRAICHGSLPSFTLNENGVHIDSQQKGKGLEAVKDKPKGKKVIKKKAKGAKNTKDKSKGSNKKNGKGIEPDTNVGGRGKKTNPLQFQCPWVLLLSKESDSESWMVKTLITEHKCLQTRSINSCTSTFLSEQMLDQVAENPEIPVKAVQEQFQRKYELGVSKIKAYRAKVKAKKHVQGDYTSQYAWLRDYVNELQTTNPGSTVRIEVEQAANPDDATRKFKRIYVCLGALKQGFKTLGRELLGLDGAFMKGPFPGQILTAVGIDPNNGIYPVCFAIVEAENLSSWTWFLELLGDDLELGINSNFTFISDRQKGIQGAISRVFPCAEHRFCLRHIHENMKITFKGKLYKDMIWKCATSTTVVQFQDAIDELRKFNKDAHLWLSKIPPKHWSRSHFSDRAVSDVLLNNMCEVYNGKIVEGRDKPIISALEYIREYLMRRIVTVWKVIDRNEGLLTPTATKNLEIIKKEATRYNVLWNGESQYQVSGPKGDQCVVDIHKKICACRRWELTGMPCKHAVATIWFMDTNGQEVGLLESWVHPIYRMERWKQVYSFKINPINGRSFWSKSQVPTTITPPNHHKQVGRPRKARKRSSVEMEDTTKGGRLSKKGSQGTCGLCREKGHNSRTCKGQKAQV